MSEGDVFHEKQRLELCAIHALNNVLQEGVFTKETADDICKRWGDVVGMCVGVLHLLCVNPNTPPQKTTTTNCH